MRPGKTMLENMGPQIWKKEKQKHVKLEKCYVTKKQHKRPNHYRTRRNYLVSE